MYLRLRPFDRGRRSELCLTRHRGREAFFDGFYRSIASID
jgi:hypothetical protein